MRICFFLIMCLAVSSNGISQIFGNQGYLIGNSVELGISGNGGYEGADTVQGVPNFPIHFRSNSLTFNKTRLCSSNSSKPSSMALITS